jgi:dolichol-phosphate mannosyltransferase
MDTPRYEGWRARAENRFTAPILRLLTPEVLRFARFALVGGSGVAVNMVALWFLHVQLGYNLGRSSVAAISLAIGNNFLWNNFWTFGARGIQARRLAQFVAVSLVGMAVNIVVLHALVALGHRIAPSLTEEQLALPSNLIGILTATAWNFYANTRWTWGDHAPD